MVLVDLYTMDTLMVLVNLYTMDTLMVLYNVQFFQKQVLKMDSREAATPEPCKKLKKQYIYIYIYIYVLINK